MARISGNVSYIAEKRAYLDRHRLIDFNDNIVKRGCELKVFRAPENNIMHTSLFTLEPLSSTGGHIHDPPSPIEAALVDTYPGGPRLHTVLSKHTLIWPAELR